MTDALEMDALWEDFHRVVNMTSQELATWLRVRDADENAEPLPEEAGSPTGQHVLAILQKRRTDLTDDDIRVMRRVVDTVTAQTDLESEPETEETAQDTRRRHRLMTIGHDPLKP
jgi:ethanolamine utilization protein EutP (predicted NTPase)